MTPVRHRPASSEPDDVLDYFRTVAPADAVTWCIAWPYGLDRTGYPRVSVPGRLQAPAAHIIAAAKEGRAYAGDRVRTYRSCGNRACVNPDHVTKTPPQLSDLFTQVAAMEAELASRAA